MTLRSFVTQAIACLPMKRAGGRDLSRFELERFHTQRDGPAKCPEQLGCNRCLLEICAC